MLDSQSLIQSYASSDAFFCELATPDAEFTLGNPLCDDRVTIQLQLTDEKITKICFSGENLSTITTAACNFFGDLALDQPTQEILSRTESTIKSEGFIVSPRRRRAAVMPLLAAQNALLSKNQKKNLKNFDDILDD